MEEVKRNFERFCLTFVLFPVSFASRQNFPPLQKKFASLVTSLPLLRNQSGKQKVTSYEIHSP